MGTKADLVKDILDYTDNDESTFSDHIDSFIRAAEERIWFFIQVPKFRKTVMGVISEAEGLLNLPPDYLALANLFAIVGGVFQPIDNKDESYLREVFPSTAITGRPRVYAQQDDNTVLLAPMPDQNYPCSMTYFYRPASLADGPDAGTTWLSEKAYEAIKYGALVESAVFMKMQETATSADYEKQFMAALTGLANLGEVRLRKDTNRGGEKRKAEA